MYSKGAVDKLYFDWLKEGSSPLWLIANCPFELIIIF